jgi:hypothetical protein
MQTFTGYVPQDLSYLNSRLAPLRAATALQAFRDRNGIWPHERQLQFARSLPPRQARKLTSADREVVIF